jgi:hypothetical protein
MNNDQNAFPVTYGNDGVEHGMTLRDYFAAKAMQAIVSNNRTISHTIATLSYEMADAMLQARGQK